jgi:hypothetical protein
MEQQGIHTNNAPEPLHGLLRWVMPAAALMVLLVSSCDFPASPPLRTGNPDIDPKQVDSFDSAQCLIPLLAGNRWQYIAIPEQHAQQPASYAIASEVKWAGKTFYDLRYAYFMKAPVSTNYAFPALLSRSGAGISLYERFSMQDTVLTRAPKLAFTLPYPVPAGTKWTDQDSDYDVRVVSKDTLVRMYNTVQAYRCYQYDVQHRGRDRCTIFVAPGKAFLRIEFQDITFHTVGWTLN